MAENGDRRGRGFESRFSRTEVLLGLAHSVDSQTEETLNELYEQDIFWDDKEARQNDIIQSTRKNRNGKSSWSNIFPHGRQNVGESAPVDVPNYWPRTIKTSHDSLSDEEDEDEMVWRPPHEFFAHYNNINNGSFSVVEGNGRTLKGRDLRKVRDAVFQQTGLVD